MNNSNNNQGSPYQGSVPPSNSGSQYPPNNQYPGEMPPPPYQPNPYGNPYQGYPYGATGYQAPIDPNVIRKYSKKLKHASVAQIVLFFTFFFAIILIIIFASLAANAYFSDKGFSFVDEEPTNSVYNTLVIVFVIILVLVWVIGLLVTSIIGAIAANQLTNVSNHSTLMMLYIIGIFIPLLSLIAAFMSLSTIKKINI